jgi:hypothetical protein
MVSIVLLFAVGVIFFVGGAVGFGLGFWVGAKGRRSQEGFPVMPVQSKGERLAGSGEDPRA